MKRLSFAVALADEPVAPPKLTAQEMLAKMDDNNNLKNDLFTVRQLQWGK